jgi:endogenous inhibitor of DNA gyrase (YacG/DUF329 family)
MGRRWETDPSRTSLVRCPICRAPFDPQQTEAMPFCSRRCQQLDLGRWLNQEYTVPVDPDDGEEA